jgi:hypothetical protein
MKERHQVITQWHHDHEIKYVGEIDARQQYNNDLLLFGHK